MARKHRLVAAMEEVLDDVQTGKFRGRITKVNIPAIDVKAVRAKTKLSQQKFADVFGVNVGTLRNWERGARRPDGPARTLLTVIDRNPKAVLEALHDTA